MTTIAFRDGLLAADSQVNGGGVRVGVATKCRRTVDGHLWAVTGSACWIPAYRQWVEMREGEPQKFGDRNEGTFILITPAGAVREWWGDGWCESQAPFFAWGSGTELALGAMAMGATAEEAVRVAIQFDTRTGGEVATLRLPGTLTDGAATAAVVAVRRSF